MVHLTKPLNNVNLENKNMRPILNASKRLYFDTMPPMTPGVFYIKDNTGTLHMSGPTSNLKALYLAYKNKLDNKSNLLSPLFDILPSGSSLIFEWTSMLTEKEAIEHHTNSINLKDLFRSSDGLLASIEYIFDKKRVSYYLSETLARSIHSNSCGKYQLIVTENDTIVLTETNYFKNCNIPVLINGVTYANYKQASCKLKLPIETIAYRCNSVLYPEWCIRE